MSPYFIALMLTDVLLLTFLVTSPARVWWWAKLIAIVVVLAFNFLAWSSADSGTGWAKNSPLPEHAQFVSCAVIEPDITAHTVGVIYVWAIPLDFKHGLLSYRPSGQEPRAYTEPYDRSLHRACMTAQKATQQGVQATIRAKRSKARSGHKLIPGTYQAYLLPSPVLPRKEGG